MTKYKILKKARKLIKKFKHWTDGPLAVCKDGGAVNSNADDAYARCALGALYAVANSGRKREKLEALLDKVSLRLYNRDITDLNEDPCISERERHRRVLAVYAVALYYVRKP